MLRAMSDNIIDINRIRRDIGKEDPTDEPMIWQCTCGSYDFELYNNGDVRCSACNQVSNTMRCFHEE